MAGSGAGTSAGRGSSSSSAYRRSISSSAERRSNGLRRRSVTESRNPAITTVKCGPHEYQVGLYGWRRRCLYGLVLLLLVVVMINLALTLFIFRVLDFSQSGMGGLQIVPGGVVTNGNVHILDTLVASRITSRPHAPIRIMAAHNITMEATNKDGYTKNSLFLDEDSLHIKSNKFNVRDLNGKLIFSASKDEVKVGAKSLKITGEGGAVLSGSLQTQHVTAPVGDSLLLESKTRNLEVVAPNGIALESRAGAITAHCLDDLTLQSSSGMIKFDTRDIFLKGLPTSTIPASEKNDNEPTVYQVCICSGGRVFLAESDGVCAANSDICR